MWKRYVPWPFRNVLNFFTYRKYVNKLDRQEIEDLRDDIRKFGFNNGVEMFQENYESMGRINNYVNKLNLQGEARLAELEKQANKPYEHRPIKSSKAIYEYDQNWMPSIGEMAAKDPIFVVEPYVGLKIKRFDFDERSTYVMLLYTTDQNDDNKKVFISNNPNAAYSEAMEAAREMGMRLGLPDNFVSDVERMRRENERKQREKIMLLKRVEQDNARRILDANNKNKNGGM